MELDRSGPGSGQQDGDGGPGMSIGFLGCGTIAAAMIEGLVTAGHDAPIVVSPRSADIAAGLATRFGTVAIAEDNQAVLDRSSLVVIAVRPQIVASVLELPLERTTAEEGAAFGAALLGGVAAGFFADVHEAVAATVRVRDTVEPEPGWVRPYADAYQRFRSLYPALRPLEDE